MEPRGRPARLAKMRRLPFFFALALLAACVQVTKAPVIPARDLARLAIVAEALLRDDGYRDIDRLVPKPGLLEDDLPGGGVRLHASKDDANVLTAAHKQGFAGVIGNLFFHDKSSASTLSELTLDLLPRAGGHEVRINARSQRRDAQGILSDEGTPYGYDAPTFADRLMRAYGVADAKLPALYPDSLPLPAPTPALQASPTPTRPARRRSEQLFGKPKDDALAP